MSAAQHPPLATASPPLSPGHPLGPSVLSTDLGAVARPRGLVALTWRQLRRDWFALAGGAIVLLTLFLALAAPLVAPHDPLEQDSSIRLSPIGTEGYWLGTDGNGRDILS